jgi:Ca2+-binding EF-hand superfamily protein
MMVYLSSPSGCYHSLMADFQKEFDAYNTHKIQMSTFLEALRRKERQVKRYKEKEAQG